MTDGNEFALKECFDAIKTMERKLDYVVENVPGIDEMRKERRTKITKLWGEICISLRSIAKSHSRFVHALDASSTELSDEADEEFILEMSCYNFLVDKLGDLEDILFLSFDSEDEPEKEQPETPNKEEE